jgi:hypothetical protein
MKKFIVAVALATVMAAPAFARTATIHHDVAPQIDGSSTIRNEPARDFEGPAYVGQDPDPRIQSELRRDEPDDR